MLAWLGQPKSMIPDAPKAVQHGVDQLGDWLNQKHEIAGIHFTAGKLLIALLLLLLFIVGSWVIRFVLRRYGSRHQNVNQSSIYTIERVVHLPAARTCRTCPNAGS